MTTPDQLSLAPQHVEILSKRGIPEIEAVTRGVRSITTADELPDECPDYWTEANGYLPGLLIPWVSEDGRVEYQIRPDNPPVDKNDRAIKYATRSREDGYEPVLWLAKKGSPNGVRLLTEGTCQTLAAAVYAPEDVWVYGMVGCRGWMSEGSPVVDLYLADGNEVVVALDADMWSNVNVWDAGEVLQRALRAEGADSIRFLKTAAGKKTGLDDVLGTRPADRRTAYLGNLIKESVAEKFPAMRRPKKSTGTVIESETGERFFGDNGLLAKQLAEAVYAKYPTALTQEGIVAIYKTGVFHIDGQAFNGVVAELLDDMYRPAHKTTVHDFMAGTLYMNGLVLPENATRALLNVENGMLDLVTGELLEHDPSYLSGTQIPVVWDADATCPAYEAWAAECIGDQLDDLEESVSMMLDPSVTPSKAVFLFGKPRSGKSTFLRIMQQMAGQRNFSAVTLHQLVENRFAAANVYGKILNVAADLSAAHLDDISIFKMMTGEDPIQADRKHGKQFAFTNKALFAFSANNPPTVGEGSSAYTARIKPFKFDNSFEGRENPAIEVAILKELPGILVRWVKAYQRMSKRGHRLATDAAVMDEFGLRSDRVRQFVQEACTVGEGNFSTATDIGKAFKVWAEMNNNKPLGRNKIAERLSCMAGVTEARDKKDRRGYNIAILPEKEWGQSPALPAVSTDYGNPQKVESLDTSETLSSPEVGVVDAELPELPEGNPLEVVLAMASPVPAEALTCENCGSARELVPPALLWFACRSCHPGTFTRG